MMRSKLLLSGLIAALPLIQGEAVLAVPISATFSEIDGCGSPGNTTLSHELGTNDTALGSGFPESQRISLSAQSGDFGSGCNIDFDSTLGPEDDWLVTMENLSPHSYEDVFFVGDLQAGSIGNADGEMLPQTGFTEATPAFRIDGIADGLVESMTDDLVFAPGEIWTFVVLDFDVSGIRAQSGAGRPVDGGCWGACSPGIGSFSTSSILANRVPEPSTLALVGVGLLAIVLLRRRTQAQAYAVRA